MKKYKWKHVQNVEFNGIIEIQADWQKKSISMKWGCEWLSGIANHKLALLVPLLKGTYFSTHHSNWDFILRIYT